MPVLPLSGFAKPSEVVTVYGIIALLLVTLTVQVCILVKIENYYNDFLLGRNKRGRWSHQRKAIKEWNDAVRQFCESNEIEIQVHKRLRYPTTFQDLMDNY